MLYNLVENVVFIMYDVGGENYEFFMLLKDSGRGEVSGDLRRGNGIGVVFVVRN